MRLVDPVTHRTKVERHWFEIRSDDAIWSNSGKFLCFRIISDHVSVTASAFQDFRAICNFGLQKFDGHPKIVFRTFRLNLVTVVEKVFHPSSLADEPICLRQFDCSRAASNKDTRGSRQEPQVW